jgi:hypothetical protein
MKAAVPRSLALLFLMVVLAIPPEAQECPNCDCYQFPLPTVCAKCCSVATGKVESVTDTSVTVDTSQTTKKKTAEKFVITPKTRKNAKIEKDSLVTVYYRRDGNIAEQIDMVAALDGLITPANMKDPPVPESCGEVPPDAFRVYLGDSLGWSFLPEMTVIRYLNIPIVRIRRAAKGIAMEVHLFEPDGRPAAVMVDNRMYLNPDGFFHVKTPDGHSLLLYDKEDHVVFVIQNLNPHSAAIFGQFQLPGSAYPVIVDPKGIMVGAGIVLYGQCSSNPDGMIEVARGGGEIIFR